MFLNLVEHQLLSDGLAKTIVCDSPGGSSTAFAQVQGESPPSQMKNQLRCFTLNSPEDDEVRIQIQEDGSAGDIESENPERRGVEDPSSTERWSIGRSLSFSTYGMRCRFLAGPLDTSGGTTPVRVPDRGDGSESSAFPDFMEEACSSWDLPASGPSVLEHAGPLASLEGADKLGQVGLPPVDFTIAALVQEPSISPVSKGKLVACRQLWRSQARVPDMDKAVLLDVPISPGPTFGPAVEEILQRAHRERKESRQVAALLPSHASSR
ncbi:UNVERIFIED_CONTAM: hypothetical protein FKN15_057773 [Acipenser sinensis]